MNGVINFLKPPGMSSNGAVVFLRGVLKVKKTGHAGTLDPGACGVLPICVGKATRISSYMMSGKKEYICEVSFGKSTDTGDSYGSVTRQSASALPDAAAVADALSSFQGNITQQTPAYSAVKQDGVQLYKLARRGAEIQPHSREISIFETEYMRQTRDNAHLLRVVCGKGTYIRQLCEDIGERLGLPAYMSFLVRTKCSGLDIAQTTTADALKEMGENAKDLLLPAEMFLSHLPKAEVMDGNSRLLRNGGTITFHAPDMVEARVYDRGQFLGIGAVKNNQLKISTFLVDV